MFSSLLRFGRARACSYLLCLITIASACDDVTCPVGTTDVMGNCVTPTGAEAPMGMSTTTSAGAQATEAASAPSPMGNTDGTPASGGTGGASTGASSGLAGMGTAGSAGMSSPAEPAAETCSTPNGFRCINAGGEREQCINGSWAAATGCAQGEVCLGTDTNQPGECVLTAMVCQNSKGMRTCDGSGTLYQCDENGVIEMQTPCLSADLCMPGVQTGQCAMCAPGSHRCIGAALETCSATGDAWGPGQTCASDALCDEDAGQCNEPACTSGQKMCMGDDLVECNQQQTEFREVKTCGRGLCNSSRGECNVCQPSTAPRCEGMSVVTCSSDGSMENRSACDMACNNGRCGQCSDGSSQACGTYDNPPCRKGTQTCIAGVWGSCRGEVEPVEEVECDDTDNNCDGETDECDHPKLHCNRGTASVGNTMTRCLPNGSYLASCLADGCTVSGTTLNCECGNGDGTERSSINFASCAGGIKQVAGKLECG